MSQQEWQQCFLWEGLPSGALEQIGEALPPPVPFGKGQVIDLPSARGLMLLLRGRVRAVYRGEDHAEHLMKYLDAGQVFGAAGLFAEAACGSTVIALCDGAVQFFPEELLLQVWQQYPQAAIRYIRFLTERVQFLNRRLSALSESTAEDKLWHYLVQHCREDGTVALDRSMTALAKTLGISRASLYRCLEEMQQRGQLRHHQHTISIERMYQE